MLPRLSFVSAELLVSFYNIIVLNQLYYFTVEIWLKWNLIVFSTGDGEQNMAPPCEHMKNQCVELISCNIANLTERECPNYFLLTRLFNVSVTDTVWTFLLLSFRARLHSNKMVWLQILGGRWKKISLWNTDQGDTYLWLAIQHTRQHNCT